MKHLHHILPAALILLCSACGDDRGTAKPEAKPHLAPTAPLAEAPMAGHEAADLAKVAPSDSTQEPVVAAPKEVSPAAPAVAPTPAATSTQDAAPKQAPLVFHPALPEDPVMTVNGESVPASRLLRMLLEENFTAGVSNIVLARLLDLELQRTGTALPDSEIDEELLTLVSGAAPGKTLAEIQVEGKLSLKHLRSQARTNRGWKKLFWDSQKIPADQRTEQTNTFIMQFFMKQAVEKYERRVRGSAPEPIAGAAAQIIDRTTGNEIVVGASEALDFLMGLVRNGSMLDAATELSKHIVMEQLMKNAGKSIGDGEPAAWTAQMRADYPGMFGWDQICRLRGTTPEREQERWWRTQAWKRSTGQSLSDEQVDAFLAQHKDFFMGKTKRAAHILVRTRDEVTGLSFTESGQAAALKKIELVQRKLEEGTDFGWLAENYSDDSVTAKGQGRIGQVFKEWGGGLDPVFQKAAWDLESVGQLSAPVKSQFGWHIIRMDEITPPAAKQEPKWKEASFWKSIRDEAETFAMQAWLLGCMKDAKVEIAAPEQLFKLKERSYVEATSVPKD